MTVREDVVRIIVETLHRDGLDPPTESQRFVEELGIDSYEAVALVLALESFFNIEIGDSEPVGIHNVGEAIALVERKLAGVITTAKAVILDVDGTLINSVDAHALAWQDAFRDFGHEFVFEDIRRQIGKGGDQLMPVFLSKGEIEARGEDLEAHRGAILRERYFPTIKSFPGVRELLQRLQQDGIQIVLASSGKKDELGFYKRVAHIEDLVEKENSSDDVEKSKPYPHLFEAALALLKDVQPSEVIVIGDTPFDAEAAGKAGLRAIGMLCGGFPEEDLQKAGCIAIYGSPAELLAQLDNLSLKRPS